MSRAVASRPVQPVLANILVEALEDRVRLTGYDLDLGIVTEFPAQVDQAGSLLLPARLLGDIVSRLPNLDINLKAQEDGQATLECGAAAYQIRGMNAEEYPPLPELPEEQSLLLGVKEFLEGIGLTLFAAATDESKQILTGVHLKTLGESLEFATTDGHRLALMSTVLPEGVNLDLTIPGRALRELERILAASPAEGFLAKFDRTQILFTVGDQTLTSRIIEGQYPNYGPLFPKKFIRHVTVDRKELISVLERIAVLASQKNNIVRMELTEDSMTLAVDAPDVGSGREQVNIQLTGDALTIAFNVKYLMDPLKALSALEIQLNLNGPVDPVVLKPVDGSACQYLIMPVHLRGA